jgi:hypothetical protein
MILAAEATTNDELGLDRRERQGLRSKGLRSRCGEYLIRPRFKGSGRVLLSAEISRAGARGSLESAISRPLPPWRKSPNGPSWCVPLER